MTLPNQSSHPTTTLLFRAATVLSSRAATMLSSRQLQHCHPEPLQGCHPDRSGGISQPWQRLRLWALCSGDPSAALRMTGLGAIPSRYNDVILSRYNAVIPTATTLSSRQLQHCHPDSYNTVIPTAVEGSHNLGRDSDFGLSVQEILRLRSG